MVSNALRFFNSVGSILPAVKKPSRQLSEYEKFFWTLVVFAVYSLLASIPMIGFRVGEADPFGFLGQIYVSSFGSLATLGILPILFAGLLMQVLLARNVIRVDFYNCTLKGMAIIFLIIGALILLMSGNFGDNLAFIHIVILGQLILGGIVVIYLDELLSKGWGYGSGVALFILSTISFDIFLGLFSVQAVSEGSSGVSSNRGIVLAVFSWVGQEGIPGAIGALFFRYDPSNNLNLPEISLFTLIITIVLFLLLNYMGASEVKASLPKPSEEEIGTNYRGNILYLMIIPVVLTSVIFLAISFFAQLLWNLDTGGGARTQNLVVSILGTFRLDSVSSQYIPTSGIVYFLTPPQSMIGDFGLVNPADPLSSVTRGVIYGLAFIGLSLFFLDKILQSSDLGGSRKGSVLNLIGLFEINRWKITKDDTLNPRIKITRSARGLGLRVVLMLVITQFLGVFGSSVGLYLGVTLLTRYTEFKEKDVDDGFNILSFYI